ncbi:MAG: prepilin-type N-terminal cleavage/methylation domain-containing protein [Erysipelotrichia bacterium]|nr:prepilin-type N-terminal cleavage/methylation domain-containing protein [Erysipelotrichia bacterium]
MPMIKNRENQWGFTLAELLIAVAIIAVLVAVSIPVFSNQLDKSKAAADQANVRSAKSAAICAHMSSDPYATAVYYYDAESGTVSSSILNIRGYGKSSKDVDDNADGIPNENGTAKIVSVTVHADGTAACAWTGDHSFFQSDTIAFIQKTIQEKEEYFNNTVIDSIAAERTDSKAYNFDCTLKEAGLDLAKMGASMWQLRKVRTSSSEDKHYALYWTAVDVRKYFDAAKGATEQTPIPIIRYNSGTGTFTVWTTSNYTAEGKLAVDNEYSQNSESKNTPKADQTYESALKIYNKLLADLSPEPN